MALPTTHPLALSGTSIVSLNLLDHFPDQRTQLHLSVLRGLDDFRRFFSSALSTTLDTFYAIAAGGKVGLEVFAGS